jgi:hypothetical protein
MGTFGLIIKVRTSEASTSLNTSAVTKFGFNPMVEMISVSMESEIPHQLVLVPPLSAISFINQKYKKLRTSPLPPSKGELSSLFLATCSTTLCSLPTDFCSLLPAPCPMLPAKLPNPDPSREEIHEDLLNPSGSTALCFHAVTPLGLHALLYTYKYPCKLGFKPLLCHHGN